jgi:hypothetical protein
MAQCVRCKGKTHLYNDEGPICVSCSFLDETTGILKTTENGVLKALVQDLVDAKKRRNEASEAFDDVTSRIPTGLPHPNGKQRIKDVSEELSSTRKALAKAHNQLSDFLALGIVPDDLK